MKKHFLLLTTLISGTLFLTNCGDSDVPGKENEEELIDKVTLTFAPIPSGSIVVVTATDPDGEGPEDMAADEPINLLSGVDYVLSISVENSIEDEDITVEIEEEAEEHMFFFGFTDGIFSSPTGNGNIDNRNDPMDYDDEDSNGYELGLQTSWTTGLATTGGTFRVVLKHQPNIKSATSTATDGETDIDITWTLNISNPL